jgi:hypothetical protein
MFKPFKPPLLKKIEMPAADLIESDSEPEIQNRPYKKRKLLIHTVEESPPKAAPIASQAALAPRKPLLVVKNLSEVKEPTSSAPDGPEGYYIVLWCVQNPTSYMYWRLISLARIGVNSRPRNIKPGMEMAFFHYGADMHDCRIFRVERWGDLCSGILCYLAVH